MKVNSVKTADIIEVLGSPKVAPEGTTFLTIDHTITNITKVPFIATPFILLKQDGTVLNIYEGAEYSGESLSGETLNPAIPTTGVDYIFNS